MSRKYYAYVGSYTYMGNSKGITIYEVDMEAGKFVYDDEVSCSNSSYLAVSHDGKYLYSVVDEGVDSFEIQKDGRLRRCSQMSINGMRGCYLDTDLEGRYLFVGGYHDGKVTVLRLEGNGVIEGVTDGIFHKAVGSQADKSHLPHVNCVSLTPDEKYLCASDSGSDQIKIYAFDKNTGTIELKDVIRCELDSGPKRFLFSDDGRYLYLVSEMKNHVTVYSYDGSGRLPEFEEIQKISTVKRDSDSRCSACTLVKGPDDSYLFASNAGDNSVAIYARDQESGILTLKNILPVSGDFPKDIHIFPDMRHMVSLNHESGTLTFFKVDYEKGLIIMNQKPEKVDQPNCCVICAVE